MSAASKTAKKKTKASSAKKTSRKTTAKKTSKAATRSKTSKSKTSRKTTSKTSSSAKPAAKAPRKRKSSPKAKLTALLEKLERAYGVVNLPDETHSTVEKAVYLVLREGGSQASTERAMKSIHEDFVDWNDVRLSRPSELARLMSNSTKANVLNRLAPRCVRLREMLDQIYNDRNEVSLEFILDERAKGQLEYLEDLDDLGIHNAYALVQWLSGDDKLVLVSPEMAQVCKRFGITDSAAVTKVKKELGDLIDAGQAVAVQAHLNQLGSTEEADWPGALKELLD